MTMVSRLKFAAAVLCVTTAITSAFVWGESSGGVKPIAPSTPDVKLSPNFEVANRFTKEPVITYETQQGETLFALQLKATLPDVAPRPRDILIMIDTSASQAGKYLLASREVAKQVVADADVSDRISLWVVNTPKATRNLTKQLASAKSQAVDLAVKSLKDEYASGAVDLKAGIEQAVKEFEGRIARQQILLYVGDGESAASKLSEKERYELAGKLRAANIQVFAVPVGGTINAQNIHSLTMGTGGAVVRLDAKEAKQAEKTVAAMVERLNNAIRTPVLMPTEFTLNATASEIYPTRLPPLRPDVPVLVVGRFEKGKAPAELKASIKGRLAGKPLEVQVSEAVPAPGLQNFFLNAMVSQWKDSGMKDAPALLRSDRTLVLAYEQGRLNRDEYLTQFNWALGVNQIDAAKNLVDAAAAIDPSNPEVKAGLKIVELLKTGKMTIEQFKANPAVGQRLGVRFEKQADGQVVQVRAPLEQVALQDPAPAPPKADPPAANVGDAQALLRAESARRAVEEQKVRLAVEETLVRGRERLRDADPKTAKDILVAQRDSILSNPDISEATRAALLNKMELLLQEIGTRGESIVRAKALADEALAKARARITNINADMDREDRIRERIRNFNSLMAQARFEEAYREALIMQQENVNRGEPVPVETQAIYQMGQAATNLREMRELTRIREDRFLLTMMQVEKSHIPYPDEPPVHFPPSRIWRDLRESRKQFSGTELGNDLPPHARRRMDFLKSALETPISIDVESAPLKILLSTIEDLASPPGSDKDPSKKVKILLDEKAFKNESNGMFDVERLDAIKLPGKLAGVSLATALRLICEQMDATFWVRRDYIEIVPAGMAIREKVIRVFPVEDLVIPVPKSINTQSLNQSLQVLGSQSIAAGQLNQFGQIQGGFGGNNGQGGGGNAIGQFMNGNRGGPVNLGAGGGAAGFGGGQLGQFGNLGGQFGFQGGLQDTILVRLITEVVAKGEWTNAPALLGGQAGAAAGGDAEGMEGEAMALTADQLNSLGFYPPALALVVRGTSRIHRSQSSKLQLKKPDPANFMPGQVKANADVKINDKLNPPKVAKFTPKKELLDKDMSPEKIYQEVLAKGQTVPGEIIATVDFMVQCREFKHAAELLKAGLRAGLIAEPWAQEALAMSLEASQGSSEEIERARLSGIDLEPKNPIAYLKAAKAMTAMGNPDRAIRFCKEAARIEPNLPDPYVNALAYAADGKATPDVATDVWAAQNLLGHDWMLDSSEYHLKAREHLKTLAAKFSTENRVEDAKKVQDAIETDRRRDLVIQLLWTGPADLDLKVNESIGTHCNSLNKQTTAGGTLLCDDFSQKADNHSETYTAAEAFNGVYRVTVDRVWGAPLGGKATIKVIRHQGTPNQQTEIHTLLLKQENSVSISFDGGRRTHVATVPPPAFTLGSMKNPNRDKDVVAKLRAMTSTTRGPMKMAGGVGSATRPGHEAAFDAPETPLIESNMQAAVTSSVPNGLDMRQQTTVTKDGNIRMTMAPVFETVTAKQGGAKMELIPGGGD